jgi:phage N-6-adenine-methyltransferase
VNYDDRDEEKAPPRHTDKHAVRFSSAKTGTGSDSWTTPRWLFDMLDREFGPFTLDAAASKENALCLSHYSEEHDGLTGVWLGKVWCNPPYSDLAGWLAKGYRSVFMDKTADRVVMLVPARTDTKAFQAVAPHAAVFFLKGRLKFGDGKNSAPFPSAVLIFDRDIPPQVHFVEWKP